MPPTSGPATSSCSPRTPTPPRAASARPWRAGPVPTSPWWSPTPPGAPGARARPTSRWAQPGCSSSTTTPAGDHGPGATALIRPEGADLFGLGAREAVLAALGARDGDRTAFGTPAEPDELAEILTDFLGPVVTSRAGQVVAATEDPHARWAAQVAAYAHGWTVVPGDGPEVRLRRFTP